MAATCGIQMGQLRSAASCCIERLHRGIYAVVRLCPRHRHFWQLADQATIDLAARADAKLRNAAWRQMQANLHTAKAALIAEEAHPDDVLSHSTAALLQGLPVKAVPRAVELTNPNLSRRGETVHRRRRQIGEAEIADWRGFAITSPRPNRCRSGRRRIRRIRHSGARRCSAHSSPPARTAVSPSPRNR